MRMELVAIHTALTIFTSHEWIRILTASLSILQSIRHHNTNPGILSSLYYHHHMLLLGSITDFIETKRLTGFHTTLHKIRAHTNIRGTDLVDAAAKMAVRNFNTLPEAQAIRVDIGEIAPRPSHWVMYTTTPPRPDPALATSTNRATLSHPWWTIPEAERVQIHIFTRSSQQLRLKVTDALLRSLNHTFLYQHLIIANEEKWPASKQ